MRFESNGKSNLIPNTQKFILLQSFALNQIYALSLPKPRIDANRKTL